METSLTFKRPSAPKAMKVLFVNVNEEDTSFLTKDVPIKVVNASSPSSVEAQLEATDFDALVMDLAGSGCVKIRKLKQGHNTPVLLLADSSELSKAIEFIKQGADGFLLRGRSTPTSFLELTKSVNRCNEQ